MHLPHPFLVWRACAGVLVAALMASPAWAGPADGPMGFDDDPQTIHRIDHADPVDAAIRVSQLRFGDGAGGYVVLGRSDDFADNLAAAPLTSDAPLLLTPGDALPANVRAEIDRLLNRPAALVYVLGGPRAISDAVVGELTGEGYEVRRLAGATRVQTAIAVADEVLARRPPPSGPPPGPQPGSQPALPVLLVRAFGTDADPTSAWADSVTGGAWAALSGVPVLLTTSSSLHPDVAAALERYDPAETILLGGASALSAAVEASVPRPRRVAGTNRAATAVEVVRQLWGETAQARRTLVNLDRADGWAFGLPVAGGAAIAGAPLLAVSRDSVPPETSAAVDGCDDLLVLGDNSVISSASIGRLDRSHAAICGTPPFPPAGPAVR